MELLALLGFIVLVTIALAVRKRSARKRFIKAVNHYDDQRSLRIAAGGEATSIPTVEEFLAAQGELHLLAEVDWHSEAQQTVSTTIDSSDTCSADTFRDEDDDGYESFVEEMWQQDGVDLKGIVVEREAISGLVVCTLHSFVAGRNGYGYLNLYEDRCRKTYAADGRHRWRRFGQLIDSSAFLAIQRGADPDAALREQIYASSFQQAALPGFDRFQTADRKYAIACKSDEKGLSYRVVSKIIRFDDRFSARCHFRWGERRTFLSKNLIGVMDLQTGEQVEIGVFLKKRK